MRTLGKKDLNSVHFSQAVWFNFAQHCLVSSFAVGNNSEESLTRDCKNVKTEDILATLVGSMIKLQQHDCLKLSPHVHWKGYLGQDVDQWTKVFSIDGNIGHYTKPRCTCSPNQCSALVTRPCQVPRGRGKDKSHQFVTKEHAPNDLASQVKSPISSCMSFQDGRQNNFWRRSRMLKPKRMTHTRSPDTFPD